VQEEGAKWVRRLLEILGLEAAFEKTCATTQKNVKSHVFWILKKRKKTLKNVRIVSQATITESQYW